MVMLMEFRFTIPPNNTIGLSSGAEMYKGHGDKRNAVSSARMYEIMKWKKNSFGAPINNKLIHNRLKRRQRVTKH